MPDASTPSTPAALREHLDANFRAGTIVREGVVVGAWFVGRVSPTRVPDRHAATVVVAARRGRGACMSAVLRQRSGVVDAETVARAALGQGTGFEPAPIGAVEPEEAGFGGVVGVMDALATERGERRRISRYVGQHVLRSCARVGHGLAEADLHAAIDAHLATMGSAVRPFLLTLDQGALDAVRAADGFDAIGDLWPGLDATFGPPRSHLQAALREAPDMAAIIVGAHRSDPAKFQGLMADGGIHAVLTDWHGRFLPPRVASHHADAHRALSSLVAAERDRVGRALDGHAASGPRHVRLLHLVAAMPAHAVPDGDVEWASMASVADAIVAATPRDGTSAVPGPGETWGEYAARLRMAGGDDPAARVGDLARMSHALAMQVIVPVTSGAQGVPTEAAADLAHEALFSGIDLPRRLSMLTRWLADPDAGRLPDGRRVDDWSGHLREPWASLGPGGWRDAALARQGGRAA